MTFILRRLCETDPRNLLTIRTPRSEEHPYLYENLVQDTLIVTFITIVLILQSLATSGNLD